MKLPVRVAADRSARANPLRTVAQAVVFWGIFLFVIPPLIAWAEHSSLGGDAPPRAAAWLGAAVFLLCSALGVASAAFLAVRGRGTPLPLDTARELVTTGPYAYVRNPMAVAGLGQGFGVALVLGSPSVALYVLIGGLLWQIAIKPSEEADLATRFGEPYRRYRETVRCWIPHLKPYRSG